MFERFTVEARQVVIGAQQAARTLHDKEIRPEHLLISMLRPDDGTGLEHDPDSIAVRILREYGIDAEVLVRPASSPTGTSDDVNPAGLTDEQIAALGAVGIDVDEVTRRVEEVFGPGALHAPVAGPPPKRRRWFSGLTHIPFTAASKKVLELSLREALALKHRSIGAEHVLLGLLRADHPDRASEVLHRHGVTHAAVRARVVAEQRRAA